METGEILTRWTIRVSVAFYALAIASSLLAKQNRYGDQFARIAWTGGCLACLVHVLCAFHFYHAWSHAAAYQDTARQTAEVLGIDWGGGLYFNYVFVAAWILDSIWWWRSIEHYRTRPRWLKISLHCFFAFMFFNATVVFESGPVRWTGLTLVIGLTILWLIARGPREKTITLG